MAEQPVHHTIALKDDKTLYTDLKRPDQSQERYFRCTVSTHPDESAWVYVNDTIHPALHFHRDQEIILPEWAIEALKDTKIRQMIARFAPFQRSIPYFPRITRRYIPEVIEEVSYQDYAKFRDEQAHRTLPGPSEGANSIVN